MRGPARPARLHSSRQPLTADRAVPVPNHLRDGDDLRAVLGRSHQHAEEGDALIEERKQVFPLVDEVSIP